ncbi:hypothetical protein [Flavobacterium sp. RS13.1]|uniref:hypothetical protein n=1 Tax=Flavobacterium sp. RS13.1 TaxID=3400345 RepID=UPI003AAF4245
MTQKESLKNDIFASINVIKKMKPSDSIKVRDIYFNLTNRFRNLGEKDFETKLHYEFYLKSLNAPAPNEVYLNEIKALTNQGHYVTSDNFFQIKMSIASYLDWIE